MKNVTVALDDDVHRKARIRAAEMGTSLSALVKRYLESLADPQSPALPAGPAGVRDVNAQFRNAPTDTPATTGAVAAGAPWLVDGKPVHTPDGKPRQPGALRGQIQMSDDWDAWPEDMLKSFEAWEHDDPKASA